MFRRVVGGRCFTGKKDTILGNCDENGESIIPFEGPVLLSSLSVDVTVRTQIIPSSSTSCLLLVFCLA